ncbi:putative Membrane protein [uncultured Sphingopyxis sp.]|uniref:Putative Membrane protein n=1 Tax=uncultured Sphingopyxis sp. TaxID=310581 RepID=A0A1Y5PYU2_9SPHN|nr:DedA family protein [uncultured Sphingopyxis sp.]SBV32394.1 putative Membrane protein [uncultured Sphingopyxis sp.]
MFDWLLDVIRDYGYFGLFLLMLLENIFPPIPSELIVPLAGFACARGEMDPALVLLASTAGSVAGALPWYYLGRAFGRRRTIWLIKVAGLWLTLSLGEFRRAKRLFDRFGWIAVLFGRLVPAVRTLISVPAGLAPMALGRFLILTIVGSAMWNTILIIAGYVLKDQYAEVEHWVNPVTKAVVLGVIAIYVVRLALKLRQRRAAVA